MNKIYNPKPETWSAILERPTKQMTYITVKEILRKFRKGDEASQYTSF
jgi:histidinol dehydrogenase